MILNKGDKIEGLKSSIKGKIGVVYAVKLSKDMNGKVLKWYIFKFPGDKQFTGVNNTDLRKFVKKL
jgi:hypothetical protein